MDNSVKRIKFINFWSSFNTKSNYFTDLLDEFEYKYVIDEDNPNIIISSVFYSSPSAANILKYNSFRKIFYTPENIRLHKLADLNLTFDHTNMYNNIRFPTWLRCMDPPSPIMNLNNETKRVLTPKKTEKFCCFVYSKKIIARNKFCKQLSLYKKVDCGGGCLNNVGGKVKNKIKFQSKYKFAIAFENSAYPGYCTEKIIDAYNSNCIPIYGGSKTVSDDFNPETFINASDFHTYDQLIRYIIKVDNDDKLYQSYMNKPIYSSKWLERFNDPNKIFFKNVAKKIIGL